MKQIILILLLITACSPENGRRDDNNLRRKVQGLGVEGPLTSQQYSAAKDICNALKFKRLQFESLYLDKNFHVRLNSNDCDGNIVTNTVIEKTLKGSIGGYYFTSSFNNDYFEDVGTDKDGHLIKICELIEQQIRPNNTARWGNNLAEQYGFSRIQTTSWVNFAIVKYKDYGKGYRKVSTETYRILNNKTSAVHSVVYERELTEKCPNGIADRTLKEVFIKIK